MFQINVRYLLLTILLFLTEVFIALCVRDDFIRPHFGDFLVVILIYCFLKSFFNITSWKLAVATLLFSYLVEILQYFRIVEKLGLSHSTFAKVVIGTSFSWIDLLAYTLGIAFVLIVEYFIRKTNRVAI